MSSDVGANITYADGFDLDHGKLSRFVVRDCTDKAWESIDVAGLLPYIAAKLDKRATEEIECLLRNNGNEHTAFRMLFNLEARLRPRDFLEILVAAGQLEVVRKIAPNYYEALGLDDDQPMQPPTVPSRLPNGSNPDDIRRRNDEIREAKHYTAIAAYIRPEWERRKAARDQLKAMAPAPAKQAKPVKTVTFVDSGPQGLHPVQPELPARDPLSPSAVAADSKNVQLLTSAHFTSPVVIDTITWVLKEHEWEKFGFSSREAKAVRRLDGTQEFLRIIDKKNIPLLKFQNYLMKNGHSDALELMLTYHLRTYDQEDRDDKRGRPKVN